MKAKLIFLLLLFSMNSCSENPKSLSIIDLGIPQPHSVIDVIVFNQLGRVFTKLSPIETEDLMNIIKDAQKRGVQTLSNEEKRAIWGELMFQNAELETLFSFTVWDENVFETKNGTLFRFPTNPKWSPDP